MPSAWNMFVKKIYEEGVKKNSNYSFKEALKDASKRKNEMGSSHNVTHKTSKKRMGGGRRSRKIRKNKKTMKKRR